MRRADSLQNTLMLGKIEGGRRRGQQRMRWLAGITDMIDKSEQALGVGDGQGTGYAAVHEITKSWTRVTELN